MALEQASFAPERQEGQASIKHSIRSPHQEVWVLRDAKGRLAATSTLRIFAKSLRIYSIAVSEASRGLGLGQQLLDHGIARARTLGKATVSLEVDAANPRLVQWYTSRGFAPVEHLCDYYGQGQDGIRMRLRQAVPTPTPSGSTAPRSTPSPFAASRTAPGAP